ncbi:MAG: copper oxidase [Chloroflexi bacterium]|nr:copper oxidase [Chloroflexota bacterium]
MTNYPLSPSSKGQPSPSLAARFRRTLINLVVGLALVLAGLAIGFQLAERLGRGSVALPTSSVDHAAHGAALAATDWPAAPVFARGNQELAGHLVEGVREFQLTARPVRWSILPTVPVSAYTFNGTVPGPLLRLKPGERVRIRVTNELPEPTSVHWHGLAIPNDQDGAASITQPPIPPGQSYVYEWTVPPTPGTYWYHAHYEPDRQQALGLFGALIIEDPTEQPPEVEAVLILSEWTVTPAGTLPAMPMSGMEPNYFTINGKSWPETERLRVRVGQRVRLRFINAGQFLHPMHLHGQPFTVVASDGHPLPTMARLIKDTLLVSPGERYDVEFVARAPGRWLLHCHIAHHTTNDNREVEGGGGLTLLVEVD